MLIKQMNIDELVPYANNARTHSDEQVAQIAASIREFGFNNPILVDGDRGLIAGHGRLLGARKLGLTTVPVIELAHLSPTQKRAYILADNRLAESAGWDNELLGLELTELQDAEFDLDLLGFSLFEMANSFDDGARGEPESSAKEISPDDYKTNCTCPKCGFEFDDKKA